MEKNYKEMYENLVAQIKREAEWAKSDSGTPLLDRGVRFAYASILSYIKETEKEYNNEES